MKFANFALPAVALFLTSSLSLAGAPAPKDSPLRPPTDLCEGVPLGEDGFDKKYPTECWGFNFMMSERIGVFKVGQDGSEVSRFTDLLGPITKGKRYFNEATGAWSQLWTLVNSVFTLAMSSDTENGEMTVVSVKVQGVVKKNGRDLTIQTSGGIVVGSSYADVKKAYGRQYNELMSKQFSKDECKTDYGPTLFEQNCDLKRKVFVAGDFYEGALIFVFRKDDDVVRDTNDENMKVDSMYLGAHQN